MINVQESKTSLYKIKYSNRGYDYEEFVDKYDLVDRITQLNEQRIKVTDIAAEE